MKSTLLIQIIVVAAVAAIVVLGLTVGKDFFQGSGGVAERAVTKLFDTKTFKATGRIEAEINGKPMEEGSGILSGISSINAFIDIVSSINQKNKENLRTSSRIILGVDAEGMQITGTLELITVAQNIYLKIVSLPPAVLAFLGGIDDIQNQWISIDFEELKQQYIEASGIEGIDIDESQLTEQMQKLTEEMLELLSEKVIFDIKQEFGREEIGDITAEHYLVSANKTAVKNIIIEYAEITKKYIPESQKQEYEQTINKTLDDLPLKVDQFWDSTGGIDIDIWVEKGSGRLVKFKYQKGISPSNLGDASETIKSIVFKIDFTFSDFNKKMEIEAPTGTRPIDEVLSDVLSSFIPENIALPQTPEL